MVTIKDVAKEAGVGVGTVSRYINGDNSVKSKNKILIDDAIKRLGYEVNSIARSMKTQKTMTIGVVVHSLTNMFSMKVIENIEKVVGRCGYSVIIAGCGGKEEIQCEKLIEFKKRRVDGIVILPVGQDAKRVRDIVGSTPCIIVDRLLDENIFDSVTVDNETMVYEKMCEIIKLGFKNIGIIEGPKNISNANERKSGFFKALKKYNMDCCFSTIADYDIDSGFDAMKEVMKTNCDCVFVSNKEQFIGALRANGTDNGIYIVGFDEIELPWLLDKACSSIPQPIEKIGKTAAELLIERISNPDMSVKNVVIRD